MNSEGARTEGAAAAPLTGVPMPAGGGGGGGNPPPAKPARNEKDDENNSDNEGTEEVREQDRFLPIANISRIMKRTLPENAKIAKDAKETVQECVSEFISFITSEGSWLCCCRPLPFKFLTVLLPYSSSFRLLGCAPPLLPSQLAINASMRNGKPSTAMICCMP